MVTELIIQGAGTYSLTTDRCLLGRDPSADVVLPQQDTMISRHHGKIERGQNGDWWIVDMSSNGIFINGGRVRDKQPLRDGDEIAMGGWRCKFRSTDQGAQSQVTPGLTATIMVPPTSAAGGYSQPGAGYPPPPSQNPYPPQGGPYPPPYGPPPYGPPPSLEPKSPVLALVLSLLLVGAGQIYNGEINKGIAFFGSTCAMTIGIFILPIVGLIFILPLMGVYFWSVIDAFTSAERINRTLGRGPGTGW